jgi:serine/threonine protein kinase
MSLSFRIEPPPVFPGEVLSDGPRQYTISSQIGLGNYSSVWLAESAQSKEQHGGKLVAIKMLHESDSVGDGLEMSLAKGRISLDVEALHEGIKRLLFPISIFDLITSSGSNRLAFVFKDVYGPSIYEYAKGCPAQRMDWDMGKRSIQDMISGLEFLHLNGIGHGGKSPTSPPFHFPLPT